MNFSGLGGTNTNDPIKKNRHLTAPLLGLARTARRTFTLHVACCVLLVDRLTGDPWDSGGGIRRGARVGVCSLAAAQWYYCSTQ
jgi:hypothetical protein